jgi:transposase
MHANDRRRRRWHSAQFKAEAVAACQEPGASLAGVALERQVNANLLRRWVKEAAGKNAVARIAPLSPSSTPAFLPVAITRPKSSVVDRPIRVQLRRGSLRVRIEWPSSAAESCASWLKGLVG